MNHGWPQTTEKSHNKKSLKYKSGKRGVGGSQSLSKDKESVKLTDLKKKTSVNQYKKTQQTTEFSPEEIQNKV